MLLVHEKLTVVSDQASIALYEYIRVETHLRRVQFIDASDFRRNVVLEHMQVVTQSAAVYTLEHIIRQESLI